MFIGMPGWHLRDKKGCDLPGSHNETNNSYQPVQLLALSDHIRDARSGQLASELGFDSWDDRRFKIIGFTAVYKIKPIMS